MTTNDDWTLIHYYYFLVKNKLAKPLRCTTCDALLEIRIDEQDEPMLHCVLCRSYTHPGSNFYNAIKQRRDDIP